MYKHQLNLIDMCSWDFCLQLEKLLRASQEGGGRKRRKGVLQTLKSIPEGQTGFDDTPENVEQGAASGQLCADGPQQHELVTGH